MGKGKTFIPKFSITAHFIVNNMFIFKKSADLQRFLRAAREQGNRIGFVPTMGALHAGHLSLIAASRQPGQLTVASIFVNPAQFNDKKDFEKYPVTLEKDIEMLVKAGCGVVFVPSVNEVYPQGYTQPENYDLGFLETVLEGPTRPGHFQGVCKVMHRLLDIVQPDNLYMGQKDYQQCMVVNRLLAIINSSTTLHTCPTLREPDGLAMSSRNTRLNTEERKKAVAISGALQMIKDELQPGPVAGLIEKATTLLQQQDFMADYVAIADAQTLEPVVEWNGKQKLVALVAAFQGDVRLIDNIVLNG